MNIIKTKCRICGEVYYKRTKTLKGHRGKIVRGMNTITCSPKCSKLNVDLKNGKKVIINGEVI